MSNVDESVDEESVRDAVERSQSGAPAAGSAVRDRFSADEIFQRVVAAAVEEVNVGLRELFFSGLAAGFAIALTFMLHASFTAQFGGDGGLAGEILYPLGFIYIIVGNYQLYTENTLPPVTLVLERLASIPRPLRIWIVVLAANVVGAGIGAYVLANTGVLSTAAVEAANTFGTEGMETPWWDLFYKGGFAGFIVAGVVWLDYAPATPSPASCSSTWRSSRFRPPASTTASSPPRTCCFSSSRDGPACSPAPSTSCCRW